ncbi:MAG: sigma-70 family RNA polymerase sigma factor [Acidobacteriia bacterium]|nr:sigma-70 family RNA polymerase sigma factor [Terriglobia bacterium]
MPPDPDTAIGGPHDRFPSTRLSLLEAASAGALPNDALGQVVALYWKPVYKYIRLKRHKDNEEAKDLTQSFFASALERDFFQRFDPQKASFRTYLRMALDRFTANEHAAGHRLKRGGEATITALDFARAEAEAVAARPSDSPEELFQREWQRQLFALAVEDLRGHCARTGKQLQFQVFEEYDLAGGERPPYAELARRHGIAVTALNNHLAWSRRMLRELVVDRLRGVTSGERELREETRAALGRRR